MYSMRKVFSEQHSQVYQVFFFLLKHSTYKYIIIRVLMIEENKVKAYFDSIDNYDQQ